MGAGSSSQKPLTAMARPHHFEKASPTAMDVAAGLEHFILADGFGNHVYTASPGRAASASPFDPIFSIGLSALSAEEVAPC
jgi:hypothetical protein